jgi:hypothetical protein
MGQNLVKVNYRHLNSQAIAFHKQSHSNLLLLRLKMSVGIRSKSFRAVQSWLLTALHLTSAVKGRLQPLCPNFFTFL